MSELITTINNNGTDAVELEKFLAGEIIKTPAELSVIVFRKIEEGQDLSIPPETPHLWHYAYMCLQIILDAGICERMTLIKAVYASTAWANEDRTEMTLTWLD
jgi:hypothetical protein